MAARLIPPALLAGQVIQGDLKLVQQPFRLRSGFVKMPNTKGLDANGKSSLVSILPIFADKLVFWAVINIKDWLHLLSG